jgi:dTDP-4-dehydrorhamnose 3,5-epimerase
LKVTSSSIPEVLVVESKVFGDARGFFYESFNQKAFNQAAGLNLNFVQDNHSLAAIAWAGYAWFPKTRKGVADVL